ncbi:hypothetical protein [Arenibaculum pallidiluteum]|uniref:hypothetical protein n=1 Tax=Arenibaculum pallidiluteum TaxID=2812559 RepID=UPI001A9600E0|nr:hypothetical protein [Arenibaculum pallidiluteum]
MRGRPMRTGESGEDFLPLKLLAETVDTLRKSGFVSLRSVSAALNDAITTGEPDAIGFAMRSFQSLDGTTRQEIAERAIRRAYELATSHGTKAP